MLKINLLPTKQAAAAAESTAGTTLLIASVATLVAVSAVLIVFHSTKMKDLDAQKAANAAQENQVRSIRARVADHDKVRSDLAEIKARQDAITHLEAARTGPTAMLIELSHILTFGNRPTVDPAALDRIRRTNPQSLPDEGWHPETRLWLTNLEESSRDVSLSGTASDDSDIAQLMRRLMLSQFFTDVALVESHADNTRAAGARGSVQSLHTFKITAKVRY